MPKLSQGLGFHLNPKYRGSAPSFATNGFSQVTPQIVSWEGLGCKVPQGHAGQHRQILQHISGLAAVTGDDGQLTPCLFAVLGPSGAGKTTFMDILSGRKRDSGRILFQCS